LTSHSARCAKRAKAFEPLALNATVVDELLIIEAQERMKTASAQLDKEVEAARRLPMPR
jgi:hypothetical protein